MPEFKQEVMTVSVFRRYVDGTESTRSVSVNPTGEDGGEPAALAAAVADAVTASLPYSQWIDCFMSEFVEAMNRRFGGIVDEDDEDDDEDWE